MSKRKMEEVYLTPDDVQMRLANSIVCYKKKFFFAKASGMELRLYNLKTGDTDHVISANSPDLDVRSPELGYVNFDWGVTNKQTWFVYRVPYRKQKQGIACDNLSAISHVDGRNKSFSTNYLIRPEFEKMLLGIYPTFAEVIEGKKTLAFNRNYAVIFNGEDASLAYNGNVIGKFDVATQAFKLDEAFNHSVTVMKLAPLGVSLY